jgi:hypothetical protein
VPSPARAGDVVLHLPRVIRDRWIRKMVVAEGKVFAKISVPCLVARVKFPPLLSAGY